MKLRVVIADDEAPARRELKYLLGQTACVDVVGEASSGPAALRVILESQPQLVFLDVQMPAMTGLELSNLLCRLPEKPLIIFSTAFEKYALAAFDAEAFDYILKPYTFERINKAVMRAVKFLGSQEVSARAGRQPAVTDQRPEPADMPRKIPLYKGEKIIPTSPRDIIFARIEEGEISVRTIEGGYRTKFSLNEIETRLQPAGFVRVHRSALVNTNHVKEVIPWYNGSYKLVMDDRDRSEILVSRYNVKELKKYLNI